MASAVGIGGGGTNGTSSYPNPVPPERTSEALQKAIEKFKTSLPPSELASFQSFRNADDLKKHMESLYQQTSKCNLVNAFCNSVQDLAKSLEPYHAAISSCAQASDIVSLIWGACQLLFKVCSNYATFVEKVMEMLHQLARELDIIEKNVWAYSNNEVENIRNLLVPDDEVYSRLSAAMFPLFGDLVDFCSQLYRIFSPHSRLTKARSLALTLWTPFDSQFADLKKRILDHKSVLKLELQLAKAQRRNAMDSTLLTLLSQLNKGHERIRSSVEAMEIHMRRTMDNDAHLRKEYADQRIEELKKWLQAPNWQDNFEELKAKRTENSAQWILQHPIYKWWSGFTNESNSDNTNPSASLKDRRNIILQGKPGFGKSILCSTIVENLRRGIKVVNDPACPTVVNRATCFYFFSKQRATQNDSVSALRAITAQTLHLGKTLTDVIDIGMVMKNFKGSGQPIASPEEVKSLLSCFLIKIQKPILVFDGLDECVDYDRLLSDVKTLTSRTNTNTLFCGRPHVQIPKDPQAESMILVLHEGDNDDDIMTYVHPELLRLIDDEMLILDYGDTIQYMAKRIVQKSKGMFLWVHILFAYLKDDCLTPDDRSQAIQEMNLFDELDQLLKGPAKELFRHQPNARELRQKFSFSLYASSQWSQHGSLAVRHGADLHGPKSIIMAYEDFLRQMDAFLCNKRAISAWTEISWIFGFPPDITELSTTIREQPSAKLPHQKFAKLYAFESDLVKLKSMWSHVLEVDAGEIWEPSIPAFMKSQFLHNPGHATVRSLASISNPLPDLNGTALLSVEPVVIETQSSHDGLKVGIIKVWPCSLLAVEKGFYMRRCNSPPDEVNIMVHLAFKPEPELKIGRPSGVVESIPREAHRPRFRLPVSFSADLQQITVLMCLIRIPNIEDGAPENKTLSNLVVQELRPFSSRAEWYRFIFSPTSRYLALLEGSGPPSIRTMYESFSIVAFEDKSNFQEAPRFESCGKVNTKIYHSSGSKALQFHPTQSVMLLSRLGFTSLWFFSAPSLLYDELRNAYFPKRRRSNPDLDGEEVRRERLRGCRTSPRRWECLVFLHYQDPEV
ncbi:hypothetical protein PG990_010858 [Apiospora arundinis]